jgi:hypothetical protein
MKLMHNIFWNYQNNRFPGTKKFQPGIYEGFKMFSIRLGNGVFRIVKIIFVSGMNKNWIVLEYRQQS